MTKMRMRGYTGTTIVVILSIAIVAILYLSLVGVAAEVPEVNAPEDDPTDGDRDPTAYGIIHVSIEVDNAVDRYTGDITSAYMTVFDYLSFDEGKVYETDTWDILGIFSDDMESWVFVKISGPGQFYFEWESEHEEYSLSEWGHESIDFSSGKCYFWDKGDYSMTVTAYTDGDSGKFTIATETVTFTVSV